MSARAVPISCSNCVAALPELDPTTKVRPRERGKILTLAAGRHAGLPRLARQAVAGPSSQTPRAPVRRPLPKWRTGRIQRMPALKLRGWFTFSPMSVISTGSWSINGWRPGHRREPPSARVAPVNVVEIGNAGAARNGRQIGAVERHCDRYRKPFAPPPRSFEVGGRTSSAPAAARPRAECSRRCRAATPRSTAAVRACRGEKCPGHWGTRISSGQERCSPPAAGGSALRRARQRPPPNRR